METGWLGRTFQGSVLGIVAMTTLVVVVGCFAAPLLCVGLAGVALTRIPTTTPLAGYSVAALQQLPESRLTYPSGDVLGSHAWLAVAGLGKGQYAVVGFTIGTQDGSQAVENWYDAQLRMAGWTPLSAVSRATPTRTPVLTPIPTPVGMGYRTGWQRADFLFYLSFSPSPRVGSSPVPHATVFATELQARH
jgi:hypothetical protein